MKYSYGRLNLFLFISLFVCIISNQVFSAESLIYNNSNETGYYFYPGAGEELIDYGYSSGGNISRFVLKYYSDTTYSGNVTVRFYRHTDDSYKGTLLKTIKVNNLSTSRYENTLDYQIPLDQQFTLGAGNLGYSMTFSRGDNGPMLASGGLYSDTKFWAYDDLYGLWYTSYLGNAWGGFYFQLYADDDPAPEPNLADISGTLKYDDDADGVVLVNDDPLVDWEVFIDNDLNGIWDPNEPNTVTNSSGEYEFTGYSEGNYRVVPVMPEGWYSTNPVAGYYDINLNDPNIDYSGYDFALTDATGADYDGYIMLMDKTTPVEGVKVEAYQGVGWNTPTGIMCYTDSDGYYSLELPTPFTGIIKVDSQDFVTVSNVLPYFGLISGHSQDIYVNYTFSGGSGQSDDPYLISTPIDFQYINVIDTSNSYYSNLNKYYRMTNDISLAQFTNNTFNMIGSTSSPFSGVFDGGGYTVSDLTLAGLAQTNIGMFRYVTGYGSKISNLIIDNFNIDGGINAIGTLAGTLDGATIEKVKVINSNVAGENYVGIVAGMGVNNTEISMVCTRDSRCESSVVAGGIVSVNGGLISNCYSSSEIYFTGICTSTSYIAGIVGHNGGTVQNCYANGPIYSDNASCRYGITAYNTGEVTQSFWDRYTMNVVSSQYGSARYPWDMVSKQMYIDAGWDLAGEDGNGTEEIWVVYDGLEYPSLSWEQLPVPDSYSGGSGTLDDPWLISKPEDMMQLSSSLQNWQDSFKLTCDLDMTGYDYIPVGDGVMSELPFLGTFDGCMHAIRNITFDADDYTTGIEDHNYIGLFGFVSGADSVIKNLGIENSSFVNGSSGAGAIAGALIDAKVENCWVKDSILTSDSAAGGLIGRNSGGIVNNSYVVGSDVSSESILCGGFVAISNGQIDNCYSAASCEAPQYAGGFIGNNLGDISNCYCVGTIIGSEAIGGFAGYGSGTFSNCLYDFAASGNIQDNYAGSKSTGQMQSEATFTDLGWDFSNEYVNGTEGIWHMPYGATGYPMLSWQKDILGDIAGSYGIDMDDFALITMGWQTDYDMADLESLAQLWLAGK